MEIVIEDIEPEFWMAGWHATDLREISHDPACLDRPGFWAVFVTFEGEFSAARFGEVLQKEPPRAQIVPVTCDWHSSLDRDAYLDYVEEIRRLIATGEVYQVNACRILQAEHRGSLLGLFGEMRNLNPSPFATYLRMPGIEIASASPELFLKLSETDGERRVLSSPIKGTSATTIFAQKDSAENIMIVDLIRNDLGRICIPGTIEVPRLLGVEKHPGLFHLVSDVTGIVRHGIGWPEIISALLPAGSISGAPKSSALAIIAENEGPRGPYCGVLGFVHDGMAVLSVGIRLFWRRDDGILRFGTGAGITWGSDPEQEWEETELKARRLISIANGEMQ